MTASELLFMRTYGTVEAPERLTFVVRCVSVGSVWRARQKRVLALLLH